MILTQHLHLYSDFFFFLSFFSASYTICLYSSSQHGMFFNSSFACYPGKTQEFLTLFLHWFSSIILILKSSSMLPLIPI